MNGDNPIDFVMIWVDGNDSKWQKEKDKYSPEKKTDSRKIRYRDWDNLQYWFRGVEKYAPWVNKVYFVTCGHYPEWLNKEHPKLVCVNHSDFMPDEFLPTFSSHPIELNLHRIKGLSENFVYFNDDLFILKKLKPTDFFINNKPCGTAVFTPPAADDDLFLSILYNNLLLINRNFKKQEILKKNKGKYINIKYGKENIRSLLCLPWTRIQGFKEFHGPNALLKSTYDKLWNLEEKKLNNTSNHKFRSEEDINQYIFKNWQFCDGNFVPSKPICKYMKIASNCENICKSIIDQKYRIICLNDSDEVKNFESTKKKINSSLEKIFPEKSSFEK